MIFLRRAKIPGHLEDHIMSKTGGSRRFTDLLDAIRVLSRRPTASQAGTFLDVDEQCDSGEEQEGDEAFVDYDSEGGELIPLDDSDLQGEYEEDDVQWALSQFRQARDAARKGKPQGYRQIRQNLQQSRIARGWSSGSGSSSQGGSRQAHGRPPKGRGKGSEAPPPPRPHPAPRLQQGARLKP
eukprot:3392036-Pyramimonas_sp.AAC.1